ncbi:hypothetical protein J6590_094382, partial [Homalodisca vitripennis]
MAPITHFSGKPNQHLLSDMLIMAKGRFTPRSHYVTLLKVTDVQFTPPPTSVRYWDSVFAL